MNPFVTISLLVLVLPSYLFLLVLGSHLNVKDLPGYEKCLSSSGLEEKDLETANNSKEMKCFDKCLLVEQGAIKEDGTVNMENLFDEKYAGHEFSPEEREILNKLRECVKDHVFKECEDIDEIDRCYKKILAERKQ